MQTTRFLISLISATLVCAGTAFAENYTEPEPLIDRLDDHTRAKVILALTGLVFLGVLMMAMTWLAFRSLKGLFRRTDAVIERQKHNGSEDDWAKKPLADKGDAKKA